MFQSFEFDNIRYLPDYYITVRDSDFSQSFTISSNHIGRFYHIVKFDKVFEIYKQRSRMISKNMALAYEYEFGSDASRVLSYLRDSGLGTVKYRDCIYREYLKLIGQ